MKVEQEGVSVEVKVQRRREEKPLGSQLAEPELRAKTAWGQHLRSSLHPIIRAGIRRIPAAPSRPVPSSPRTRRWRSRPSRTDVSERSALRRLAQWRPVSLSESHLLRPFVWSGTFRSMDAAQVQQFPGINQPPGYVGGEGGAALYWNQCD